MLTRASKSHVDRVTGNPAQSYESVLLYGRSYSTLRWTIVEWILSLSSDDIENRRLVNLDTNRFFETANNRFASNLRRETFPAHKFTTFVRFPFNEIVALQLYRIPINQSLFLLPPVHLRATVKLPTKLISNESPTMLQYTGDNSVRHDISIYCCICPNDYAIV